MLKLSPLLIACLFIAACQVAPQQPEMPRQTENLPQSEPPQPAELPKVAQPTRVAEPPQQAQIWGKYVDEVGRMDAEQLLLARESALREYADEPTNAARLRAAYALSRAPASPQQLADSREILAEISPTSELAPMRDLLNGEILKSIEVQEAEARTRELRAEFDELQVRFAALQEQLDALKKIEAEMVESREETEEMEP